MLNTETNTPEMSKRILGWTGDLDPHVLNADFEHEQWWLTCLDCGAQWSVCDQQPSVLDRSPFCFEQITDGDGCCEDKDD